MMLVTMRARADIVIGNLAAYTNDSGVLTISGTASAGGVSGFQMGAEPYTLTDVVLRLNLGTNTGNVPLVEIYSGTILESGTLVAILANQTLTYSGTYQDYTFLPTVPLQLNAGQRYYVVVLPNSSSATILWAWGVPSIVPTGAAATPWTAASGTEGQSNPTNWKTGSPGWNWFQVDGAPGTLQPTFYDTFTEGALNPLNWTPNFPWATTINSELETYLPNDFQFMPGGGVQIVASKPAAPVEARKYTSGAMTTYGTFSQTYGYFEMQAQLPKGDGFWPAFWLEPTGPLGNEIDIMENLGQDMSSVYLTVHSPGGFSYKYTSGSTDYSVGYHTFAVSWRPNLLIFLVDGVEAIRATGSASPAGPAYMLANLAVGGSWPVPPNATTPFPSYYNIKSIKAYQYNDSPPGPPLWGTLGRTVLSANTVVTGGTLTVQNSVTVGPAALTSGTYYLFINPFWDTAYDVSAETIFGAQASGTTLTFTNSCTVPTTPQLYTVGEKVVSGSNGYYIDSARITVANPVAFPQWEGLYFDSSQLADPTTSGTGATPQRDGVPNLCKYAFNIDPSRPMTAADWAAVPTPGMVTNGTTQYLTLTYRKYALASGITTQVQTAPNLQGAWETVTPEVTKNMPCDPVTGDPVIQVQVATKGARQKFIRLNVSAP
jgi:beta-glucanase (GH16 family)